MGASLLALAKSIYYIMFSLYAFLLSKLVRHLIAPGMHGQPH